MTDQELVNLALDARKNAYAPYSRFHVGAALECEDGTVYTGCNIENASFPCGICAERTAATKAISEGNRAFRRIAIAGSSKALCAPCGLCRQFLYEFAPNLTVLCAGADGSFRKSDLTALLLDGFNGADIQ